MYMQGKESFYKGFLIVEHPEGTFNAYRSMYYFRAGIATYSAAVGLNAEAIQAFIDVADDRGYFTPEQIQDMMIITNGHKDELGPLG